MEVVGWGTKVLGGESGITTEGAISTYNRHLSALSRRVVFVAKALCHNIVKTKAAPEEDAHLAILPCGGLSIGFGNSQNLISPRTLGVH